MKGKRNVGRPKLADKKLRHKATLYLLVSVVLIAIITLTFINNENLIKSRKKQTTKVLAEKRNVKTDEASELYLTSENTTINFAQTQEGKCPVAPSVEGILNSNKTYNTGRVKITINTSNLTQEELKEVYVVEKPYDDKRIVSYKINGKKKKEKIGDFKEGTTKPIISAFKKINTGYSKTINIGSMYYVAIYSGSKKCYYNYFVKDSVTLNNYTRKYRFSKFNILTKKGVVRGVITNAKAASNNSKVLNVSKDIDGFSYKATGQNVYVGKEGKNKAKTMITITDINKSGKFYITLPSRYFITGYLKNPLTNSNKSLGKVSNLTKASHTKNSDGKKVYGTEIKTSANKKVYAMDSGTIIKVRNNTSKKDTYGRLIQIKSSIRNEEYIHTYANLSSISVKKGDRIYKGQVIGKTSKSYLFVSFTQRSKDKSKKQTYNSVLLNNFVGRKIFYARVDNDSYKSFQKWIDDGKECLYQYDEATCDGAVSTTTVSKKKKTAKKKTTVPVTTKKSEFTGGYTKILLVGNSYTYYNGLGQIVSKLAQKTGKKAIVVRATKGAAGATSLAKAKLDYVAWSSTKGTLTSGAGKTLSQILEMDFGNLNRKKWDYVILQNNDGNGSIVKGDKAIYAKVKKYIDKPKNFILNATTYSSSNGSKRYSIHLSYAKQIRCSVIRSGQLFEKYGKAFNRNWVKDLTICDGDKHPSGRGAYLNALTIYAKIYGVSDFASSENSSKFIELYNKDGGTTNEFVSNWYRKNKNGSNPSSVSNSVDKKTAKKLQMLVRKNYKSSVLAY